MNPERWLAELSTADEVRRLEDFLYTLVESLRHKTGTLLDALLAQGWWIGLDNEG